MFDNADTQEENQPDHIEKDYFSEANALSRDVNVRQTHLPIAESTRLYENDLSESDELHHNDDAKNKMFIEKKQNFDHVSDNEVDDDDDDVDDAADGEENDDNSDAKVDDNYGEVNDAHQVIDDDDDDAADGEEDMDDNNGEVNDAHQIDDDDEMDDEDINAEVQYNDDDDAAKMDEHEAINDADNHNTNEEEECDIASEEEDYIVIEEGHVSEVDVMEENRVGLQRKMLPIRQRFVTEKQSLTLLVEKYMPLEYRQELIPVARSGNIVEPK
uniref:Protein PFC0760c-like n=1 Tax=Saccoglossus kowalevskii TaxID=10224 RepID=A0ABM0M9D8_SACKO|nr:PREDICTED: protein PFC0760c-like [Saccoglossus kowalevskii]